MAETGARAQALLAELLNRKAPFARAWRQLDYIIPITTQSTMREPCGRLYGMLPELTGKGVSSIDFVTGFPPADIHDNGASVFAYGTDQAAVETRAVVECLSDGSFPFTGEMYDGSTAQLGPSACLRLIHDSADVRVIVGTARCQNADQAMFSAFGIDPSLQQILAVKSTVHFLADYEPIAEQVIFAEAAGANVCRMESLPFTRLRPNLRLGPNSRRAWLKSLSSPSSSAI